LDESGTTECAGRLKGFGQIKTGYDQGVIDGITANLGNKASNSSMLDVVMKSNIYNANHLKNWRKNRGRMLNENLTLNVAFWGDSITEGYYASNPFTLADQRSKSYVGLLNNYYKTNVGDVGVGWVSGVSINI
jgi:lysophospholipase L1-like esterase